MKNTYVLQKTFINFYEPQFLRASQHYSKKKKIDEKYEKLQQFGLNWPYNYGLPDSFITLSTWRTTKRG